MRMKTLTTLLFGALLGAFAPARAADVPVGLGAYRTTLNAGGERQPPATTFHGAGPLPTNQWYSSLLFAPFSHPLYAQPLSYQATARGFQLGVPDKVILNSSSRDEDDISYPHVAALTVRPLAFALADARLDRHSAWAIDILTGDASDQMRATIAHGSPYSYYQLSRGDVRIDAAAGAHFGNPSADQRTLALTVGGKQYAIFAPYGASWQVDAGGATLKLPAAARYFSIAALPDDAPATLALFARHAYAFIRDTRVSWHYDAASSSVITSFDADTDVKEGPDHGTLLGLYPHQWHANPELGATLPYAYPSVRGQIRLIAGHGFRTRVAYHGILPHWPGLSEPAARETLARLLRDDLEAGTDAVLGHGSTYWEGKGLGRAAQLLTIAEQQGEPAQAAALLAAIKARLEHWMAPAPGQSPYFHYDARVGTLIGYPDEFGSASEINDHHFHYGYWIGASAQVALRDPAWAARSAWGGMVELLAADIATGTRDDARFPFLRHFDPYESHSWASGTAPFSDGNNQESSSEAINAWAGLILWGEATGNTALRDTGIYLYTSEIEAARHYWFDQEHLVFAPEYRNTAAGIVWGDKYVHATWWTEDPREIHGINLLPITPASLYLGRDPAYVRRNLDAMDLAYARYLKSEREQHASPQIWQDILLQYSALHDPKAALARWDPDGPVEQGDSASHTYFWLQSLAALGKPDFTVRADTPLYGVFQGAAGKRQYLAYNAGAATLTVHFSDGFTLTVAPRSLARGQR